ncbi:MAG: diadenylate cyclase CdaA [Bacteroidales bacterium]|nr:diadenylate cyclase CdaA [Bacteroidales bacterium]
MGFFNFGFVDLIDILLTAYILYFVYQKFKGSTAMNIIFGVFIIYIIWMVVRALNMSLISTIMNNVASVGLLALVVVFHPEIRKFLLDLGNKSSLSKFFSIERIFHKVIKQQGDGQLNISEIVKACASFAEHKVGALIVLPSHSDLTSIIETGERLDCNVSARILDAIFFKNAPLHDGAVIIVKGRIVAAKCVLPVSANMDLPKKIGLRHRSGIGMSEVSDSLVVIVSEERGEISYSEYGGIVTGITPEQLSDKLKERFAVSDADVSMIANGGVRGLFRLLRR